MQICEFHEDCVFFNASAGYSPALNDAMKDRFCRSNNSDCARRKVIEALGRHAVPVDMLPTDYDRLESILSA